MACTEQRTLIGVVPAAERSLRTRLFDAFELAYPVRFVGRDGAALGGLDAVVRFPGAGEVKALGGAPSLSYLAEERAAAALEPVSFTNDELLARPLHDAALTERHASGVPTIAPAPRERVLASVAAGPVWSVTTDASAPAYTAALAPAELREGHALRSRLAPGRCLGVLALTQFIRSLTAQRDWVVPGLRAAFVIDDPNLRRPTYGHINYPQLAASGAAFGYHTSIAMVPLDGRRFDPRAARLFREHAAHLSLCVHGNDHVRDEFRAPRSLSEGMIPVTQAIVRSREFERRTGLTIDRVMVAPHERLGQAATAALAACGFEGFSGTRPYPWLDYGHDLSWLSRPADAGPLVGWQRTEVVDTGLLALLRVDFSHPREELVIRAFLGQPLIMYGHHDLLRGGTGELERAAQEIGRLGDVQWTSLSAIARSSVPVRRRASTLEARLLGRRGTFEIPPGVSEILVDGQLVREHPRGQVRVTGPARRVADASADDGLRLEATGPGPLQVTLEHRLEPLSIPLPRASLSSLLRRMAAEGRDRTSPKLVWASR